MFSTWLVLHIDHLLTRTWGCHDFSFCGCIGAPCCSFCTRASQAEYSHIRVDLFGISTIVHSGSSSVFVYTGLGSSRCSTRDRLHQIFGEHLARYACCFKVPHRLVNPNGVYSSNRQAGLRHDFLFLRARLNHLCLLQDEKVVQSRRSGEICCTFLARFQSARATIRIQICRVRAPERAVSLACYWNNLDERRLRDRIGDLQHYPLGSSHGARTDSTDVYIDFCGPQLGAVEVTDGC